MMIYKILIEKLGSTKSNFLILMAGEAALKASQLIVNVMIARSLGVEQYGVFSYLFAIAQILSILADAGMSVILVKEIAKNKYTQSYILEKYMPFKVLTNIVLMISIVIYALAYTESISMWAIIGLGGYNVLQFGVLNLYYALYRGEDNFTVETVSKVLNILGLAVGFGLFYQISTLNSAGLPYLLAALLPTLFFTGLVSRRYGLKLFIPYPQRVKEVFKEISTISLSQMISTSQTIVPFFILYVISDDYTIGIFSAAYRLILPMIFVLMIANAVFLPKLAPEDTENPIRRGWLWTSIAFLIIVSIVVLGPVVLPIIFGQDFSDSVKVLQILAPLPFLSFASQYLGNMLMSKELNTHHMISSVSMMFTLLLLTFVFHTLDLEPLVNVSISMVSAELLLVLMRGFFVKQSTQKA